jgi:hypothetical protein
MALSSSKTLIRSPSLLDVTALTNEEGNLTNQLVTAKVRIFSMF